MRGSFYDWWAVLGNLSLWIFFWILSKFEWKFWDDLGIKSRVSWWIYHKFWRGHTYFKSQRKWNQGFCVTKFVLENHLEIMSQRREGQGSVTSFEAFLSFLQAFFFKDIQENLEFVVFSPFPDIYMVFSVQYKVFSEIPNPLQFPDAFNENQLIRKIINHLTFENTSHFKELKLYVFTVNFTVYEHSICPGVKKMLFLSEFRLFKAKYVSLLIRFWDVKIILKLN